MWLVDFCRLVKEKSTFARLILKQGIRVKSKSIVVPKE